jgi:hypothetical protein
MVESNRRCCCGPCGEVLKPVMNQKGVEILCKCLSRQSSSPGAEQKQGSCEQRVRIRISYALPLRVRSCGVVFMGILRLGRLDGLVSLSSIRKYLIATFSCHRIIDVPRLGTSASLFIEDVHSSVRR